MFKLLIVEDIAALRQHAAAVVKRCLGEEVKVLEAANGAEAIEMFRRHSVDMMIVDICLPDISGIRVAKQAWSEAPSMKILFWSQYDREAYVREIAKILPAEAVHGYVLKTEPDEKLLYAITSVLIHDNPYIDSALRPVQARLRCKDSSLTDPEYETLMDVALGLTDKAIALRRHISSRGVQSRLSSLFAKLLQGRKPSARDQEATELYNTRNRLVFEALKRGLIDIDELRSQDSELNIWLAEYSEEQVA